MSQERPSRRQEYARLTRRGIIDAAHRLFLADGYTGASIRAIAVEANVSEQTVYRLFGDKAEVLRAVLLAAVGGDDNTAPLRDGPHLKEMAERDTPADRIRLLTGWMFDAYERGLAQLEQVVISAASSDERVAELARYITDQRYEDTRRIVLQIFGDQGPPSGTDINDLIDYVYGIESSAVYLSLTTERGWSTEKYVEWFVHMFETLFLVPPNTTAGRIR
jgi:TetR/AcrR family transcriptional regulator, regulator of autoinduction and epiphytic fitness